MRRLHDVIDTLIDTHVELANAAQSPQAVEVITNLRADLHHVADDVIKAARGEISDIEL